jgi:hypothetical protein
MGIEFWDNLRPLTEQFPHLWSQMQSNISGPTQLIRDTVCQGTIYQPTSESLALSAGRINCPLSPSQQTALNLCLASSPLFVLEGVRGSGKRRIAQLLSEIIIRHQKKLLLLTRYPGSLQAYENLPGIVCPIVATSQPKWLQNHLRQQYLGQTRMDFLPIYLQSDPLLAELRSPRRLEYWLSLLNSSISGKELIEKLKLEFPGSSISRIKLLAHRLKKSIPLLKLQLWLSQKAVQLSEASVNELANRLEQSGQLTFTGTIKNYMQTERYSLQESLFDWTIVIEAEELTWLELMLVAGRTKKLILMGNLSAQHLVRQPFSDQNPFFWLGEFLSPAYRYRLHEQFRLHHLISQPVYKALYNRWVHTHTTTSPLTLPQLTARLQWQDIPGQVEQSVNAWEGNQILTFLQRFQISLMTEIGILTFSPAQRDWFNEHLTSQFHAVKVGAIPEWAGQERRIMMLSCGSNPKIISSDELAIALTRARDYLILFGDFRVWQEARTPLQQILMSQDIQREREVVLA